MKTLSLPFWLAPALLLSSLPLLGHIAETYSSETYLCAHGGGEFSLDAISSVTVEPTTFSALASPSKATAYAIEADFAIIEVQPEPAAGDETSRLGEAKTVAPLIWDPASGGLLGWQSSGVSGLATMNGSVSGVGSSSSPYLEVTGISDGPDLDFGFFDFLQTRIRLPENFPGDVVFRFGTSTHGGNDSTSREFRIPNHRLNQNGDWETYRIDLGLIVWWRDRLTDLRIYPVGFDGAGEEFAIDYIEIGDKPGDELLVNMSLNFAPGVSHTNAVWMESKHAAFWWAPASFTISGSFDPSVMGRRALRMIEESYQVFHKLLAYEAPFESWDISRRDGNRYKVNHITWFGGFWMGGTDDGLGYFNVHGGGLFDEGWGNPVPHEFAHVVQGHQPGFLLGRHWESHANYLAQARQMHHAEHFPVSQQANLREMPLINSNFRQDHGAFIYSDFRIHHALESLKEIGLDPHLASAVWQNGQKNGTVFSKLEAALPPGFDLGDVVTAGLRRWPFLDFEQAEMFQNQLWRTPDVRAWREYQSGSLLIPSQDRPDWWRVPFARAPERFAYMYHELDANSSSITVELKGIAVMGDTEDWRWSLAALDADGNIRYSDVFRPGTQTMPLEPDESKVFLVVVATPTDSQLNLEWTDNRLPVDKHLDRLRYPYEVRMEGAQPAKRQLAWNTTDGRIHPTGGGWVANTATVSPSAYVGPNARVLGNASVAATARIEDYAVVADNASIEGGAVVSGYAVVNGSAVVSGNARVRDRGVVTNSSRVVENAVVTEYGIIAGPTVEGAAIARGSARLRSGQAGGHAILDYDYSMAERLTDGVHFSHVPWGGWYVPYWVKTKAKPRGLVASYRIEEPTGDIVWDEFGAAHGLLRGNGQRVFDWEMNTHVLRLDGASAYVVLDRNLAALRAATYSLWVKPSGANTDRAVLHLGGSAESYLQIVARDAAGLARVTIAGGGSVSAFHSQSVVPENEWTHIALAIGADRSATLYINGVAEASGIAAVLPEGVLGPNDYRVGEALYIGRDWEGRLFTGDVGDIRFYNTLLSTAEIGNEKLRTARRIGAFFAGQSSDFNGSREFQSGVRDGLERVLEATIRPRSGGGNTYYHGIFDASDEENGSFRGSGFGLRNGRFMVRLAALGFWDTGITAVLNEWQTVALAYDGSQAIFYVDGVERASREYNADQSQVAGKNFRIGFAQSIGVSKPKYFFDGEIKDANIYDSIARVEPANLMREWRSHYFGSTSDAGDAGNLADFDNDGLSNLMEYALGTDPTSAASGQGAVVVAVDAVPSLEAAVSVSFATSGSNTPALSPGDLTGVFRVGNWNNIGSSNPRSSGGLLDAHGDPVPNLALVGDGQADSWNRKVNVDDRMLSDWMNTGNGGASPRLTVTGVPGIYDFYLYTQPFMDSDMSVTVNGVNQLIRKRDVGSFVLNSTYAIWPGLQGDLAVTIQSATAGSGISGFQVVPAANHSTEEFLTLTFDHIADDRLNYAVEVTSDLTGEWQVFDYGSFDSAGTVTFVDNVPVSENTSRFVRLRVTIVP